MNRIDWILLAAITVALLAGSARASSAGATITFTDRDGAPTSSVEAPKGWDGRVSFRVQVDPLPATPTLPTLSVLVEDSSGQMTPFCLDAANGTTVAATSEVLSAAPFVELTGRSFSEIGCAGSASTPSNPIRVEFVPEPPFFTAPPQP